MANGHGGARPGAGRKRLSEKYAVQIESARDTLAAKLDDNLTLLQRIAEGGFETVQCVYEPAGTVLIDDVSEPDDQGRTIKIKRLAFPDKPADELVLVKKTITVLGPNPQVAMRLVEQVIGQPTQAIAAEIDVPADSPLLAAFGAAAAKVYGAGDGE